MSFYNAHSHIFTMTNSPVHFLELYMPRAAATAVDKITDTKFGSWAVRGILSAIGGEAKRYGTFLKIGKSKNQNEVLRHMMGAYNDTSAKMIALTLNMEYLGVGRTTSGYAGQLEEVIELKRRYPDNLYLFLSIDPRWETGRPILDVVKDYFDYPIEVNATRKVYPFAGLKLYPSTGFYAFDERLKPTMEWAAANDVPVMTHCSYLGGIFQGSTQNIKNTLNPVDPYTGRRYDIPKYQDAGKQRKSNMHSCSYFLEPYSYRTMLEHIAKLGKPLKICFAHYGSAGHMLMEDGRQADTYNYIGVEKTKNWAKQINELMLEHKGVYTDISYSLSNKDTYHYIFRQMKSASFADRILFGTDFFMTEREAEEKSTFNDFRTDAIRTENAAYDGTLAWEKMAIHNVSAYLDSKYIRDAP